MNFHIRVFHKIMKQRKPAGKDKKQYNKKSNPIKIKKKKTKKK